MIQKRMVAICDILGYKKLVEEKPLTHVVDKTLRDLRIILNLVINKVPITSTSSLSEPPPWEDLKDQNRIGVAWFSDTILFYSKTNKDEDIRIVIEITAWLLFRTMWSPESRIRAGISYGDIYIDEKNELFVGQPLIEAFKLEQDQDWSGGCLTNSAKNRIPMDVIKYNIFEWYLIDYHVPLKSKRGKPPESKLAVDWTRCIHTPEMFPWSKEKKEPSPEEIQTYSDIVLKWRNTKAFHDYVCDRCSQKKP